MSRHDLISMALPSRNTEQVEFRAGVLIIMQNTMPPGAQELLMGRFIASLGTENEDGSIHLTAVWYLFEGSRLYVATSSRSRKARNVLSRPKASLMVDIRKPGLERGLVAMCATEVIAGEESRAINVRIHRRYMSDAALADPRAGGTMAAMDDISLRLTPTCWYAWDMRILDDTLFGGAMKTPGYLLPLD
ncbi:MAG TPA: pyridoxamine 5'-phosphate oxidase family protein [Terriglobales bacterium]|nr:pyridoxamine 5'-phosphate oxidase family protein [Terriglobales bacterium]